MRFRWIGLLVLALVAWAAWLATGDFLNIQIAPGFRPSLSWRIGRVAVILGCSAAFLGFWGLMLRRRSRIAAERNAVLPPQPPEER